MILVLFVLIFHNILRRQRHYKHSKEMGLSGEFPSESLKPTLLWKRFQKAFLKTCQLIYLFIYFLIDVSSLNFSFFPSSFDPFHLRTEDSGLLTHKESLPVRSLVLGDTQRSRSEAAYKVGPLRCHGDSKSRRSGFPQFWRQMLTFLILLRVMTTISWSINEEIGFIQA